MDFVESEIRMIESIRTGEADLVGRVLIGSMIGRITICV